MKAIVIKGCKDCPYAYCDSPDWNIWHCTHSQFQILDGKIDGLDADLPETPHPDCKLNDLPTEAGAIKSAQRKFNTKLVMLNDEAETLVKYGAEWVINEITK